MTPAGDGWGRRWSRPRPSSAQRERDAMPNSFEFPLRSSSRHIQAANPVVAVVGATGAVGVELLHCLEARNFPLGGLRLLASARSAGRSMPFGNRSLMVETLA